MSGAPVCRLGEIALITRRSQVQILPPQPNSLGPNCLANADEFVEATEQVNDRQAHAEKARYLAHAQQRTRRPG